MQTLNNAVALITGASRGIGAAVARLLAERGADIVINYRSKGPRAARVAAEVEHAGRRALLAQADITAEADLQAMRELVAATFGRLDVLVLNASGGLEKDKPAEYAMRLNQDAQLRLAEVFAPLIAPGGTIAFITSHWAHFYGSKPVYPGYEVVAASKKAGEDALRAQIPALAAGNIRLVVVSGDAIEGTITPKLLDRAQPGVMAARRAQVGALPTVEDFALAIVEAIANPNLLSGDTVYVGETE